MIGAAKLAYIPIDNLSSMQARACCQALSLVSYSGPAVYKAVKYAQ